MKLDEEEKLIGNKFFKEGNLKEAIKHYTLGLDQSKNNAVLFANRGLCFFKLNQFEKCISDCEEALKIDSVYTKAYFRMALSKFNLGNFRESIEDFKISLKLDSNKSSRTECELYIKYIESFDFESEKDIEKIIVRIELQVK